MSHIIINPIANHNYVKGVLINTIVNPFNKNLQLSQVNMFNAVACNDKIIFIEQDMRTK